MTTTQTAQTTTTTHATPTTSQATASTAAATSTIPTALPATTQQITDIFNIALKCIPEGGGGGGGGGGGAGPIGPANQVPVPRARDVKIMGTLSHTFSGDRTQAEQFMEEVRTYLRLNNDIAGFELDPINDNIPEVWDRFLVEFANQYMDSAREDQAQAKLKTLKMKDGLIDEYIAKFEELC